MKNITLVLIFGVVALVSICETQEISIYEGRGDPQAQGQPPLTNADGDEVQDESELASALGIDRQALYEDLMRIQEELQGGSPPSEQNSQEDY